MKVTVILCTYNRCESLKKALESVSASLMPESTEWEVLVVDNNSRDRTRAVVDGFINNYPGRFRYLFVPKPGKSNALNAAICDAKSDILAFMDDDVRVESNWLQQLTAHLGDGAWIGAGGRILPDWTDTPPDWLPVKERYGLAPLAGFDLGLQEGPLNEPPFGTNMAFRKEVFSKYGEFRTDLGPQPGSEIRNEDTEFGQRVLDAGEQLRYEPSALVYHSVPANRLNKKYFLTWWYDKARADVRESAASSPTEWSVAGVRLRLFLRLAARTTRWLAAWNASERFALKLKVWSQVGEMVECHRSADNNQKQKV